MENLHPVVAILWHPADSSLLLHHFLIEMIQSEQEWVALNNKQAGLGDGLPSSTCISPSSCCLQHPLLSQQGAAEGQRAGQAVLQGNALPLKSPSSLEGSDTASEVQIKATAPKETTVGEKGAFKGCWARGQRESIFYPFLLPIALDSPCPGHEVSEGNVCCPWSQQSRRARDVSQGQGHVRS